MRKTLIILIIVAILATAGAWAYQNYFAPAEEPEVEREEHQVARGTLTSQVNATGTILAEKQTTLSFKNPGRVAEVLVEEGQRVQAGDLLAHLETTDQEFAVEQARIGVDQAQSAVEQAELSLASAQTQLLSIQRDPANYDLAAAQAAVDSAKASYQQLVNGPDEEEIRVARANLDQAQASLSQAQEDYDQVANRPNVSMMPQALQLEQATIARDVAQANFDLTMRDPSQAELSSARSAIVQAEASLARLQEGVADEDLLAAQLSVEQAQVGLDQALLSLKIAQLSQEQAEHQLEGTIITAPHDGTITTVGVKVGELSGGQPAFVLTDLSVYHVDVTVDEIDIGRVSEGQPVTVTLDALPGVAIGGGVDTIADTAQLDTGVVTYKVTVVLEPTSAPLRVGMTANVDIVAERRDNILLVPNRFIRIDRSTGKAFVDKLVGEEVRSVEIQIGLRDETFSEVLAGMEENDVVVLVKESSREQLRRAMEGGPPR
jgi:HlyD family secretion protein